MLRIGEGLAVTLLPAAVAGALVWWGVPRRHDRTQVAIGDRSAGLSVGAAVALAGAICVATVTSYLAFEVQARVAAAQTAYGASSVSPGMAWREAIQSLGSSVMRPTEARQRIPLLGLATIGAVSVLDGLTRIGSLGKWLATCGFCGALAARQLWTSVYMTFVWNRWEALGWLAVLGIVGGTLWWSLLPAAQDEGRFESWGWICSVAIAGLIAISLATSGSLTYGALAAGWASSLVGGWLAAVVGGRRIERCGWTGPVATFGFLMLLLGRCFAELTTTSAILLAVSLYGVAVSLRMVCQDKTRKALLVVCLLPALVAAGLAVRQAMQETAFPEPYGAHDRLREVGRLPNRVVSLGSSYAPVTLGPQIRDQ